MTPAVLVIAVVAGVLIGLSLGALGGGGSIMAVPVLIYLMDQSAPDVLLAAFATLMLVVGGLMAWRQLRHHRGPGPSHAARPRLDDPILTFSPTFACQCPRALKVLITATAVGLMTGFLEVGGGFLVVPALLLALALPMEYAAGTSLVVITITSFSALAVRAGTGASPDWGPVLALTAASAIAALAGAQLADRIDTFRLQTAFTAPVLSVAIYTATRVLPTLV